MGKQPSLVAFDVGNTSVKCGVRHEAEWQVVCRIPTAPVDSLESRLRRAVHGDKDALCGAPKCAVSSVHPRATDAVLRAVRAVGMSSPVLLGRDVELPIAVDLPNPTGVGTDRLLLALAGRELAGAPCVVASAGTAVTVDMVDPEGRFAGGAIAPGVGLATRALHERTALLPRVELTAPPCVPGRDTAGAIRAGVYWSCAGAVLTLLESYRRRLGRSALPLVFTGTDAPLLMPATPPGTRHSPHLLFIGIELATP